MKLGEQLSSMSHIWGEHGQQQMTHKQEEDSSKRNENIVVLGHGVALGHYVGDCGC